MSKRIYAPGFWFAVPLQTGGYGLGVVARATRSALTLGYFFNLKRLDLPTPEDTVGLKKDDAILVCMFGSLALNSGEWPVVARKDPWHPNDWPVPTFSHVDAVDRSLAYGRVYDEKDLRKVGQRPISLADAAKLPTDGVYGYRAVEIELARLLSAQES
jgi:hypothetical protein